MGKANLSSCIGRAADLFASQPNLSICIAAAADLVTAQANSSSRITRAADLFAAHADFIDEMLELSILASNFDQYLHKHSILFIYILWILIDIECQLLSSSIRMPYLGYSCVKNTPQIPMASSYFPISKRNAGMWWWGTWLVLS